MKTAFDIECHSLSLDIFLFVIMYLQNEYSRGISVSATSYDLWKTGFPNFPRVSYTTMCLVSQGEINLDGVISYILMFPLAAAPELTGPRVAVIAIHVSLLTLSVSQQWISSAFSVEEYDHDSVASMTTHCICVADEVSGEDRKLSYMWHEEGFKVITIGFTCSRGNGNYCKWHSFLIG